MSSSLNRKRGPRGRREMIVFDPETRRSYLRGFSERKKQRRAFGLAMQKVKDREFKLEERREARKEQEEQVIQAERHKEELLLQAQEEEEEGLNDESEGAVAADNDAAASVANAQHPPLLSTTLTKYEDEQTTNHWGGQVVVTTSIFPLDSDDDYDDIHDGKQHTQQQPMQHSVDRQQKYAGNVQKYLQKFKGKIPTKKKTLDRRQSHKGKHGAAAMTGMGGAANLKLAKKALAKTQTKMKASSASTGKKNKKHKRGRK